MLCPLGSYESDSVFCFQKKVNIIATSCKYDTRKPSKFLKYRDRDN